jgi:transcriptional regulator with GAF, ATPase, and Fis domain
MTFTAAGAIGKIRSVLLTSADAGLRQRLRKSLSGMRWQVREAKGGADAMAQMEELRPEALVMDHWLPDLEVGEFAGQVQLLYPGVDLLRVDGVSIDGGSKSPLRHELLHALREAQADSPVVDTVAAAAPVMSATEMEVSADEPVVRPVLQGAAETLPEMIGRSPSMLELARLIRLVAPTSATVLIEGETGTGKEVVAKAVHRLSERCSKAFAVLNCAAIPETLLEAELFGHTRGAFTGAVQSRTGRIEAAHGGTLFLDEIGEMPLALQAKMLRFLECGEIQRVGDNETMRVDVRVIAATHQDLETGAVDGTFRLDLYHRLAVFPLEVPPLRERMEDVPLLAEFLLAEMGKTSPRKRLSAAALGRLQEHDWPGNVRELGHVLERASILSGDAAEIGPEEIRYRKVRRELPGYVRPA